MLGCTTLAPLLPLLFVMTAVVTPSIARADEVDECIARKQTAYEDPRSFEQLGEITCAAADVVGFPPRIRRNDERGSLTYRAPSGYTIRNQSISSIAIVNLSQNNGSYGSPSIAPDGASVTVPLACSGKGVGEGRAWQHIKITGTIVRLPPNDLLKQWGIECVKCVARQDCRPTP